MADQNEMDKIVTSMMEHLCDHLCRFPWETERKEDLEDICAECKMGQYVCDILNTYKAAAPWQVAKELTDRIVGIDADESLEDWQTDIMYEVSR